MSRSLFVFAYSGMLSILFGGCALHQACVDKKHDVPQVGWVTISGTVVPATTVAVDEYGKSLADCVFESRVCDILTLQQRLRTQTPSSAAVEQLTQADTITLSSLVTRIQKLDAPALAYAEISTEVQSIQATAPGFRLPGTWLDGFPHYAFDSLTQPSRTRLSYDFNWSHWPIQGCMHPLYGLTRRLELPRPPMQRKPIACDTCRAWLATGSSAFRMIRWPKLGLTS